MKLRRHAILLLLVGFTMAGAMACEPVSRAPVPVAIPTIQRKNDFPLRAGQTPPTFVGGGPALIGTSAVAALEKQVRDSGSVYFMSTGGSFIGTDGDLAVEFLPERKIKATQFAYATIQMEGSYSVDEQGIITLTLRRVGFYPSEQAVWRQALWRDGTSFILMFVDRSATAARPSTRPITELDIFRSIAKEH